MTQRPARPRSRSWPTPRHHRLSGATPNSPPPLVSPSSLRDARVPAAPVEVPDRHPTWRANIASNLVSMGAAEQAGPLLREALQAGDPASIAATTLSSMGDHPAR